jgi:hypothetical protein
LDLRGIEVTGRWRKLHNELLNLYSPSNIIRIIRSRRMRWVEPTGKMVKIRNAYKFLFGKPEGKRPLERPRHK